MKMFITNNNNHQPQVFGVNTASLAAPKAPTAPTALAAPMLKRVHNVRPGCGSCGRH